MEVQHRGHPRKPRRFQRRRRRNDHSAKDSTPSQPPHDAFAALQIVEENEDKEDSEGEDCELHVYEHRYDSRGEEVTLRVGTTTEFEPHKDRSHRAAIIISRRYKVNDPRRLLSTHLEIRSRHIKKALREVIGTYPGISLNSTGRIRMLSPPMCLFHYKSELEAYAAQVNDPVMKSHMGLCLGYMARVLRQEMVLFEASIVQSKEPAIEHQHLWMAFKPGVLLYGKLCDVEVVTRLTGVDSVKDDNGEIVGWRLGVKRIQYSGFVFGYVGYTETIDKYDGCKPLTALKMFPLDLHPERARIRRDLVLRGRKYLSLCGRHYRLYEGTVEVGPNSGIQVRHRIMVDDHSSDCRLNYRINFIPDTPFIKTTSNEHMNLQEEEILTCFFKMGGFDLARREWAMFNVENIQDVQFNSDAFEQLVFSPEKKLLIQSLVEQSNAEASGFDDLIKGKGKGLIFLLHGPPGVGKTFTAESIADHTRRPLLQVSAGQLMGKATDVERELSDLLSCAKKWNALVLIDEADVFMQERKLEDLERNGLVSILLRVLEYFEGIIFLTTNRADTIDSAFHSRIHLSLAYPSLSPEALRTLWKNTITRACSNPNPRWLSKQFLDELSKSKVNGRDIKNIVHMAYAVAKNEKREMRAADIRQGLDALKSFEADFRQGLKQRRIEHASVAVSDVESPPAKV